MSKRLVIIDGKSIFYRGYYAMPNLTTSEGIASGGVYGFTVLAFNVIKKLKPDYVCVAWDKSKTNIRSRRKLYSQYKANRQPAPENFVDQVPLLFDVLKAFNWPLYELDDYEADDIMATLSRKARNQDLETYLVSSDLDLLQAIDQNVKIFVLKQGLKNIEEFDTAAFEEKYGIRVDQFRDLKAIMGDSSDNIPGVMGIGQKGATDLLTQYQDLDTIYKNLDDIKESLATKLKKHKDMAYLSKQLVTLMFDAPVDLHLKNMDIANLNTLELQKILRELEFYSLLPQIPTNMQMVNQSNFIIQDKFTLKKMSLNNHPDIKNLKNLNWDKPVFLHAYCQKRFGDGLTYLLASDDNKTLNLYKVPKLIPLNIKKVQIYGYDTKQLIQVLISLGVEEFEIIHDIKVGAFLLNSNRRLQSLSILSSEDLGYVSELDELSEEDFIAKSTEIGAIILEIKNNQLKEFKKLPKLAKLAKNIEWPFIPVLARLELAGMMLDLKALEKLKIDFEQRLDDLERTIFDLAGEEFNLSSPVQLSNILYIKLKLPTFGIKRNKKGYSTDAESLNRLSFQYPIVDYILQYRELAKLQNTYVESLLDHVAEDGRVYTDMRLTATSTGRLSSANPNLQTIPIKTELGSSIRQVFIAPKGHKLISADYSQFELRLAAALSKDQELIDNFNKGADIHSLTASLVFETPLSKVTKQQRYLAKTINFGVLYGQGPHSLANLTGMTYQQSRDFIDKYFQSRPILKRYQDDIRRTTEQNGYIENIFGRRRLLPDITHANSHLKEAAFRQAINMPIQGTAADLMKLAMVKMSEKLSRDVLLIMQVHDSVLIQCPEVKIDNVIKIVKDVMENIYPKLGVKLKVDISKDNHWPI